MKVVKIVVGLFLIIFSACEPSAPAPDNKPNIIFILADDLGAHDLGFSGSTYYETPNLDELAQRSFVFTNGYAASRVCSPSRASIMTGKFTARHGITDWIGARSGKSWRDLNRHDKLLPAEYNHSLSHEETTIAEAFKANNYRTFFAGKWHLGEKGSYPEDHGFDINKGGWERGSPAGGYFSPWENPSLDNQVDGENLSIRLAKETVKFIREHKDSTFFAFLSFYAVHGPIQTTQEKWKKYKDKANAIGVADSGFRMERVLPIRKAQDNPIYAGLLETMDEAIGLVLAALKELNLENNTIVVFTSDNGGVASGDAYSTSNLPLRGGKGYQWEGGIKEPYVVYVPWLESKTIDYPAIGTDFYPTLLNLANIEALPSQHIDGQNLTPLFHGQTLESRPLYWHYPHYGNQGGNPSSIIREGNWKLIFYWEEEGAELYNLESDPGEQNDVSREFPGVKDEMFNKLDNWLKDMNANKPKVDSTYNEVLALQRKNRIQNQWLSNLEERRKRFLSDDFEPNESWWGSKVLLDSIIANK